MPHLVVEVASGAASSTIFRSASRIERKCGGCFAKNPSMGAPRSARRAATGDTTFFDGAFFTGVFFEAALLGRGCFGEVFLGGAFFVRAVADIVVGVLFGPLFTSQRCHDERAVYHLHVKSVRRCATYPETARLCQRWSR